MRPWLGGWPAPAHVGGEGKRIFGFVHWLCWCAGQVEVGPVDSGEDAAEHGNAKRLPPTSRDKSFMAEATPCCESGSAEVMALVAGVMAAPHARAQGQQTECGQPVGRGGLDLSDDGQACGQQHQLGHAHLA